MKIPRDTMMEIIRQAENLLAREISNAFKFVIEKKHLYQNHEIKIPSAEAFLKHHGLTSPFPDSFKEEYNKMLTRVWDDSNNIQGHPIGPDPNTLYYRLPTVKIYCAATCERSEAFNSLKSFDVLRIPPDHLYIIYREQLFILIYQCQSCKKLPEVFMIRRNGWKINIAGRSPIETVATEPYLPKGYSKYISGAMLAFNSGQTLAGLFLLRVFIEQYSKKIVGDGKADEVIQRYSETLPKDFKERFPSLSKIYSNLSEAIHKASPDEQLFTLSLSEINEHFDGKRLYKLKDPDS